MSSNKTFKSIFKICFVLSFIITSLIAVLIAFILYVTIRLVNANLYRKALWYLMTVAYAHVAFLTDWWSLLELNIYMDKNDFHKYFGKEHALLVINHSYDIDWLPLVSICARMNLLGNIKFIIKRSLQYIPILGWSFILTEYVLLHRSYDKDEKTIRNSVRNFASYPYPLWLLLFPEGTWPTEETIRKSQAYAREMNLSQLKHHLQPRTTGFVTILREMRGRIPAVYNVEIAFREGPIKPSCSNVLQGKQMIADIYIKRIGEENIPIESMQQEHFLREMFHVKDKLRTSFIETGSFFTTSNIPVENHLKIERPLYIIAIFLLCCSTVIISILYLLIFLYRSYGFSTPFSLLIVICISSIIIFHSGTRATVMDDTEDQQMKAK